MSFADVKLFRETVEKLRHEFGANNKKFDAELAVLLNEAELPKRKKTLDKAGRWQPIRTAPKDRDILLLVDIAIGRPLIVQCCWYSVDADDKGWIDANGNVHQGTHWMPLPAPPRDI